jgi:hypothetical protein
MQTVFVEERRGHVNAERCNGHGSTKDKKQPGAGVLRKWDLDET